VGSMYVVQRPKFSKKHVGVWIKLYVFSIAYECRNRIAALTVIVADVSGATHHTLHKQWIQLFHAFRMFAQVLKHMFAVDVLHPIVIPIVHVFGNDHDLFHIVRWNNTTYKVDDWWCAIFKDDGVVRKDPMHDVVRYTHFAMCTQDQQHVSKVKPFVVRFHDDLQGRCIVRVARIENHMTNLPRKQHYHIVVYNLHTRHLFGT